MGLQCLMNILSAKKLTENVRSETNMECIFETEIPVESSMRCQVPSLRPPVSEKSLYDPLSDIPSAVHPSSIVYTPMPGVEFTVSFLDVLSAEARLMSLPSSAVGNTTYTAVVKQSTLWSCKYWHL